MGRRARYALGSLVVAIAYIVAAKFGLQLAFVGHKISPVWPPTGLALAVLVLYGERYWPAIALGAFVSTYLEGPALLTTLIVTVGNTLEPVIIARLMRRGGATVTLERVRDIGTFLFASMAGASVSTVVGIATMALAGDLPMPKVPSATVIWWVGNVISAMVLAPPILVWSATTRAPVERRAPLGECLLMVGATLAASAVIFQAQFRWVFLLLPFTIWASLRCGQRWSTISTVIISAFAIHATAHGLGPFADARVHEALTVLETFLATVSLLALILTAQTVERQRADVRLRESEARYRAIVEDQTEMICRFVPAGTLTFVSESYCRAFGAPREALLGQHVLHAAAPADRDALERKLWRLDTPGAVLTLTYRVLGLDGRDEAWQQWTFSALGDAERVAAFVVREIQGVGRDVTDERRREQALIEREEQLRQSQKMEAIGQLAGGIAHDFNNLLTTVLASADMVLDDIGAETPIREDIEEIRQAALRASTLTRQLLTFSRKSVAEPTTVDMNGLVTDLGRMLRRLIGEHIDLTQRLRAEPATVMADRGLLEQVLVNLAVNARDAMPQGGRLTIETSRVEIPEPSGATPLPFGGALPGGPSLLPGAYVVLTVSDTGQGMSDSVKERIFEPFFTTKEKGKGTGLGLATVYGIVQQCRGTISVHSSPGQGAMFRILLPHADPMPAPAPRIAPVEMPRVSETVLLVDDEDAVRRIACRVLESDGFTVLSAADPHEALQIASAREHQIHVLLTDVVMPGMSGPKLAQRMRMIRPDVRVVYMSGYPDSVTGNHGVYEPGTMYVQKPFAPAELRAKIRAAAQRASAPADAPEAVAGAAELGLEY